MSNLQAACGPVEGFVQPCKLFIVVYLCTIQSPRLHVKRRSAKTRQPVLTSLCRSVYIYMSESHSRVAEGLVYIYCAG